MGYIRRDQLALFIKLAGGLLVLLVMYGALRFIPGAAPILHSIARFLFLLGSGVALLLLALWAMFEMFKARDFTTLGRSLFGFVSGLILALMTEAWIGDEGFVKSLFQGRSLAQIYLGCLIFGIIFSEIATFTRRRGNFLLVFLCSAIGWILIQLLTLPTSAVDLNWLLAFLFGIGVDQMLRFRRKDELGGGEEPYHPPPD